MGYLKTGGVEGDSRELPVPPLVPQGFGGSRENGYLFSGSWEALVIIIKDLGSKLIVLRIYGALPKSKK